MLFISISKSCGRVSKLWMLRDIRWEIQKYNLIRYVLR